MTMLEVVRAKWCDSLIDLLECPVCNEIPKRYIYQCMSGHHICRNCRNQITKCPICADAFGKSRNYLAEELSDILENIMTSLMYPTHKINKHVYTNKICVHTQTPEISKKSMEVQTENVSPNKDKFTQTNKVSINENGKVSMQIERAMSRREKKKFYHTIGKGNYPCCIGSCNSLLPHGKMIEHLKSSHADAFFTFQERKNGTFHTKSELKYIVPEYHDLAFLIKDMGLFFVNITILSTGDLTGAVYAVNNTSASKRFTFALTVGKGKRATTYCGMVKSCRESRIQAVENCLFKKDVEMKEILLHNGNFNCGLVIKRTNPARKWSNASRKNHDHIKSD